MDASLRQMLYICANGICSQKGGGGGETELNTPSHLPLVWSLISCASCINILSNTQTSSNHRSACNLSLSSWSVWTLCSVVIFNLYSVGSPISRRRSPKCLIRGIVELMLRCPRGKNTLLNYFGPMSENLHEICRQQTPSWNNNAILPKTERN